MVFIIFAGLHTREARRRPRAEPQSRRVPRVVVGVVVRPLRGHRDVEQLPVEVGRGHRVRTLAAVAVVAVEALVRGGGAVDDVAVHVGDLVVARVIHLLEGRN